MGDLPEKGQPRPNGRKGLRSRQFSRRASQSSKTGDKRRDGQGDPSFQQANRGSRPRFVPPQSEEVRKAIPAKNCAVCGKPIFDLLGAIADIDTGEPIHFDCALEKVAAAESLAPQERVAYLGAGRFGVIAPSPSQGGALVVKKIIRWEKEGEKQGWRKDLSINVLKL